MGKSPLDKTVMFVCIRFTLPLQIPDLCCPEYSHQFSGIRRHVRLSTLYLFRSNYFTFTDLTTLPLKISLLYLYRPQMWVLPFIVTNAIGAFKTFICSCIISVGFKELCNSLTSDKPYKYFSRSGSH